MQSAARMIKYDTIAAVHRLHGVRGRCHRKRAAAPLVVCMVGKGTLPQHTYIHKVQYELYVRTF